MTKRSKMVVKHEKSINNMFKNEVLAPHMMKLRFYWTKMKQHNSPELSNPLLKYISIKNIKTNKHPHICSFHSPHWSPIGAPLEFCRLPIETGGVSMHACRRCEHRDRFTSQGLCNAARDPSAFFCFIKNGVYRAPNRGL